MLKINEEAYKLLQMHRTILKDDPYEEGCARYNSLIFEEWQRIVPWLPDFKSIHTVVDIGCGLAAIPCLLYHLRGGAVQLKLVDGNEVTENAPRAGWHEDFKPYNLWPVVSDFLLKNGVSSGDVEFFDIFYDIGGLDTVPADVIMSFRSWCFHYPVQTYLPLVERSLSADGRLIVDVKKDTDSMEELEMHFELVEVIEESNISQRCVFKRFEE